MKQIHRLGVVNRGEPAMRLLTAVTELNRTTSTSAGEARGITTVALYTQPDADSWFVQDADEAVCLGPATYVDPHDGHRKSKYLDEEAVVDALTASACDAAWVGWGFVSERASFARRCGAQEWNRGRSPPGAASTYVPMTRGRRRNNAHLVADNLDEARAQWIAIHPPPRRPRY